MWYRSPSYTHTGSRHDVGQRHTPLDAPLLHGRPRPPDQARRFQRRHERLPCLPEGHRPGRDGRLGGVARRGRRAWRCRTRVLPAQHPAQARPGQQGPAPRARADAVREHHPASNRSPLTRATRKWSGASAASSAGTPWPWSSAPTTRTPASAGTSPLTLPPPTSTKSASTTSSAARTTTPPATRSSSRAIPSPGIYARAFLEGRLSDRDHGTLPPRSRPRQGSLELPAPVAHAGLLGVPDRLHGPRPHGRHLPGPLQPLPPRPRNPRSRRFARLGVPGRRGVRRA